MPADPRRQVPRTDTLLADPAARRRRRSGWAARWSSPRSSGPRSSGPATGRVAPEQVADARRRRAAGDARRSLRPGPQRHRRRRAHQPRPGAAVGRRASRRWSPPPAPPTSSSTWPPAARARAAGARSPRCCARGPRRRRPRIVVNNCAAALALAATALGQGRELVLSRGELVEIGDGFRIPDLLASTGARLREVGTTNRTTLADYRGRVGPDTGAVLKVHPSNFAVRGFTSAVRVAELAGAAARRPAGRRHRLRPAAPAPGAARRAGPADALADGADLVLASGDKLLGGPQAGLLLGRRRAGPAAAPPSRRPGPAGGQAHAGRAGGDAARPAAAGASGAGRRRRTARAARAAPRRAAGRAGRDAVASTARRAVGGEARPVSPLPSAAVVACPSASPRRCAPASPPVVGARGAGRCLLDLRSVARRTTDAARVADGGAGDVRDRHRRARRPRQVDAGARAHRHVARPAGRGTAPRADHRPRLRLDRARRAAARLRRRPGPRAVHRQHAGRHRPGARRSLFVVAADDGWCRRPTSMSPPWTRSGCGTRCW